MKRNSLTTTRCDGVCCSTCLEKITRRSALVVVAVQVRRYRTQWINIALDLQDTRLSLFKYATRFRCNETIQFGTGTYYCGEMNRYFVSRKENLSF